MNLSRTREGELSDVPTGEVVVTAVVGLGLEEAFSAFTEQIDRWWRRGRAKDAEAIVRFEGDHLVSVTPAGASVLATVSAWEAPDRLELDWQGPHSRPGDVVVVEFEPEPGRTRVTVRHRRAGASPAAVETSIVGLWWGDVLQRLTYAHRAV